MNGCNIQKKEALKKLGKIISLERKKHKLSQAQLAELCEIDLTTVWRIEAGLINTRAFTLLKILSVLKIEKLNLKEETK